MSCVLRVVCCWLFEARCALRVACCVLSLLLLWCVVVVVVVACCCGVLLHCLQTLRGEKLQQFAEKSEMMRQVRVDGLMDIL